jgi:hypothetical protein
MDGVLLSGWLSNPCRAAPCRVERHPGDGDAPPTVRVVAGRRNGQRGEQRWADRARGQASPRGSRELSDTAHSIGHVVRTLPEKRPYRALNTWQTVVVALLAAGAGLMLIYVAGRPDWFEKQPGLRSLSNGVGSMLLVSVAVGALLNLIGKRALTREIFETARLSTDLEVAGLRRVGMDYTAEPEWEQYFETTRRLDVFVAYGRTWRNLNLTRLKSLAAEPGAEINVYLPDLRDPRTLDILTTRFNMTAESLRQAVDEARSAYLDLQVPGGARISVYGRAGDHVYTCYRFDSVAVLALYKHKKARGDVPTLVLRKGGTVYGFIEEELAAIHEQSHLLTAPGSPSAGVDS